MKIISILTTNIKNDVAYARLRTSSFTSSGGTKVFIKNKDDFESFFSIINGDGTLRNVATCKIDKQSTINYMHNLFFEYKDQKLQQYSDINIEYWREQYDIIKATTNLEFNISSITERSGGRIYIQGNDGSPFENVLWKILLPNITKLEIEKHEISPTEYEYVFKPFVEFQETLLPILAAATPNNRIEVAFNRIYFGSPGTGKSNTVDALTTGNNVRKITFHPEYDYHTFVGGYKPSMDGNDIVYKFVPQIFTKIYTEAWQNLNEPYYLQIEEINRGNCAEIFGDLFQLLDRSSDGSSKYNVDASEELFEYLTEELGENHDGIVDGKIKLPHNLSIIATMNTSDQSLFPMDSAFKRRWDWEYMKIDYDCTVSNFTIKLNNGNTYEWLKFLEAVNRLIFETTGSPDKQIGNWFINATDTDRIISEKTFINKVLFYLWNDVFKDEDESLFDIDGETRTYEDFFTKNIDSNLIVKMIDEHLGLENKTAVVDTPEIADLAEEEISENA